jgi:hypothetical protein
MICAGNSSSSEEEPIQGAMQPLSPGPLIFASIVLSLQDRSFDALHDLSEIK